MANSQSKVLDFPFVYGLRQDLESDLMAPSGLIQARNVEFEKRARLRRRDGFENVPMSSLKSKVSTYAGNVRRVAEGPHGERLVCTDENVFTSFEDGTYSEAGPDRIRNKVTHELLETFWSGANSQGSIYSTQVVVVGNWLVVAWRQFDDVAGAVKLLVDVIDMTTGSRAWSAQEAAFGQSAVVEHRMLAFGNDVVIFGANTGTNIAWRRFSLTGTTVAWSGASANLVTDGFTALQHFDVCRDSTNALYIAYRASRAGTSTVYIREFQWTGATFTSTAGPYDWGADADPGPGLMDPSRVAICCDPSGAGTLMAIANPDSTAAIERVALNQTTLAMTVIDDEPFATFSPSGSQPGQLTVDQVSSTVWLWGVSPCESSGGHTRYPVGNLWFQRTTDIITGPAWQAVANYFLGTRFFRNSASSDEVYSVARFSAEGQTHAMLFEWNVGSAVMFPRPVMLLGNGRTEFEGSLSQPQLFGSCSGATTDELFVAGVLNLAGDALGGQTIPVWRFRARGHGRYLHTQMTDNVIFAGASPLVYDGARLVELGFANNPGVGVGTPGTAGSMAVGSYQYVFVYEWSDVFGNRHQSGPSLPVSVTLAGAEDSVDFELPPIHATRKMYWNTLTATITEQAAPVRIVAYRTNVSGLPPFFRAGHATNILSSADPIAWTDTASDASLGEILLQDAGGGGGLLPYDPAPASSYVTVFGDRLWGIMAEQPETVWCSQTFTSGQAPHHSEALRVPIPGSGRIHALLAQDGKLYALAERGIWIASYGDGPSNLGQGSFPVPVFITSTANCDDARGAVETQDGLFFTGRDKYGTGIYWIRRGEQSPISIGYRVKDELTSCPFVRGVIDRHTKSRVELLLSENEDGSGSNRIVYYHYDTTDEEGLGAFTVAVYDPSALECIGSWGEVTVIGHTGSGELSIQSATDGRDTPLSGGSVAAPVVLETGDIRPFGPLGFGQVDTLVLMGTVDTATSLTIECSFDSGESYPHSAFWAPDTFPAAGPFQRHWEPNLKLLPFGSIRLRFTDTDSEAGDAENGLIWHGFSLEVQPRGGTTRLTDTERR